MQSEDSTWLQAHEFSEGLNTFAFGSSSNSGQLRTACAHSRHQAALADPAAPAHRHTSCLRTIAAASWCHRQNNTYCRNAGNVLHQVPASPSRSFSRKLSHLIWVAMQHEHHTRALFGRQGSTLLSKGSPTRCSCRSFCSSGDKRARLLHGVLTRSQHVPSPPLHTECRAKPPSEQGYWHRPPKTVLVTFYLQFFIAALDPRFLNLLKLHSHTQAGSYSKKGHPKLLLERCHCSTWHCTRHLISSNRDQPLSCDQHKQRHRRKSPPVPSHSIHRPQAHTVPRKAQ